MLPLPPLRSFAARRYTVRFVPDVVNAVFDRTNFFVHGGGSLVIHRIRTGRDQMPQCVVAWLNSDWDGSICTGQFAYDIDIVVLCQVDTVCPALGISGNVIVSILIYVVRGFGIKIPR